MKKTRVIDRTVTPKTGEFVKGEITENMVSRETSPTRTLLGTYVTIPAGRESEMRCHNNAELAWYLLKGTIKHILLVNGEKTEYVCGPGAAGYVNPGDGHQEINIGEEPAEMILSYANPNKKECCCLAQTGTQIIQI